MSIPLYKKENIRHNYCFKNIFNLYIPRNQGMSKVLQYFGNMRHNSAIFSHTQSEAMHHMSAHQLS